MENSRLNVDAAAGGTVAGIRAKAVRTRAKDVLGDRIKSYEDRETGRRAMRGLPLVVRVDGRSFSAFTRGMARPYDTGMSDLMVETMKYLVERTQAKVGYTQSDEISLIIEARPAVGMQEFSGFLSGLLSGGDDPDLGAVRAMADRVEQARLAERGDAEVPFAGRFQKLVSVIAGMATARFLKGALALWPERCERQLPVFDCRVFEVPSREEAVNALLWRELDATKNAVSMAARSHFPHLKLQRKSSAQMQEMLFQEKGINFNDYPVRFRRGVYARRILVERFLGPDLLARIPEHRRPPGPVVRAEIAVLDLPPIRKLLNPVGVLLDGAVPVTAGSAV